MPAAQSDQHVDQRAEVGDGLTVAELGPFDAEFFGLGVDAFGGGALLVDLLVGVAVAVELLEYTRHDAGGHDGAIALGPLRVIGRTDLTGGLRVEQLFCFRRTWRDVCRYSEMRPRDTS